MLSSAVKVSRNAQERRSWARRFKPGAFRLENYWFSQLEPIPGPSKLATFAIVIRESIGHSNFTFLPS